MHEISFLQDLAVVMILAGLATVLFHRFRQPVVLGYILAGFIIGPHTPPFSLITNEEEIKVLADIGIILLMFSLGLEFSLRKLKKVGGTAFIAALLEILLMVWIGYEIGRMFGWSTMNSIFLGAMLSISSTTIIIKALAELGKNRERFAEVIFGILVIEDMLAMVMIALLSGIAMTGRLSVADVAVTAGKLIIFLSTALILGLLLIPRFVSYVARFKSNEMLLVMVLGLCFGFSLLAVKLGYSIALGSFIIGAVVAEAREVARVEAVIEPVRDMFSAIFFVAIGLLIDPKIVAAHWLAILVITIAVVVGKIASCSFGAFIGGNDVRTSFRVGMGLAQIGEFSFVIAALGLSLKVTGDFLYPIAVSVSVITTLLTPFLIKRADASAAWLEKMAPRSLLNYLHVYTRWINQAGAPDKSSLEGSLIRKWIAHMALNAALIGAVFIVAMVGEKHHPIWLDHFGLSEKWLKSVFWLLAAIVSLPMFIATSRKLQALGLLVAEMKVKRPVAGERTEAVRAVIAHLIPIAGTVALGLYVLLLSSALLPPFEVMAGLLIVVAVVSWLWRRSFIRIYSKAQIALLETFSQPPPADKHHGDAQR